MAEYCYLFLKAAPSGRSIFMNHKITWVASSCSSTKAYLLIEPLMVRTASAPWFWW